MHIICWCSLTAFIIHATSFPDHKSPIFLTFRRQNVIVNIFNTLPHSVASIWSSSWNISLHIQKTFKTADFCWTLLLIFCFLGIFFPSISLPSDVQIVCSADAQGGFNVTMHDGEPQFSLMLMYYHHLCSSLLFLSALFFFLGHFFLLFHPLPLSSCRRHYFITFHSFHMFLFSLRPLSIPFITSILLTWMFRGWFQQLLMSNFKGCVWGQRCSWRSATWYVLDISHDTARFQPVLSSEPLFLWSCSCVLCCSKLFSLLLASLLSFFHSLQLFPHCLISSSLLLLSFFILYFCNKK